MKPIWSKEIHKVKINLYIGWLTVYIQVVDKDNIMGEQNVTIKEVPPVIEEESKTQEPIYQLRRSPRFSEHNA